MQVPFYLSPLKHFYNTFFSNPNLFLKETTADLKKDFFCKKGGIVWLAGLPKSGTTMLESILDKTEYVHGQKSFLRMFQDYPLDHIHGICDGHFCYFPKNKKTYIKTHTHFKKEYFELAQKYNAIILVLFRDLRDVMISRYFHVMSDPSHWQHGLIYQDPYLEGFKKSCICKHANKKFEIPLIYYSNWIKGWKKLEPSSNIHLLWYENYTKNPIQFIKNILKITSSNADECLIEEKLKNERHASQKIKNLESRRNQPGRLLSTFRKGGCSWKSFFDEKTHDWFLQQIKYDNELIFS